VRARDRERAREREGLKESAHVCGRARERGDSEVSQNMTPLLFPSLLVLYTAFISQPNSVSSGRGRGFKTHRSPRRVEARLNP
jgi:hypothetical protein